MRGSSLSAEGAARCIVMGRPTVSSSTTPSGARPERASTAGLMGASTMPRERLLVEQVEGPPAPVDKREGALLLLETLHPGIGEVRRDETGAVLLEDVEDAA